MINASRLVVCLSSFVALAAVACSGAPDPTPSTSSSKKASTAGDSTKTPSSNSNTGSSNNGSSASPSTPAPSTPLSDTSACGKKADANTCDDCCLAGTPTAMDAADKAAGDCMCAAAACATACAASVCAAMDNMNAPTDACNTCLDAHQQECSAKFESVCQADAACKAADACMTTQCDPLAKMSGGSSGSSGSSSGGAAFDGVSRAASVASFTARMMARADRQ